jgi:hypothetical protein
MSNGGGTLRLHEGTDMQRQEYKHYVMDLKIKAKQLEDKESKMTALERTVLLLAADLGELRHKRSCAKPFVRYLGETATRLVYPDAFQHLGDIVGQRYDEMQKRVVECGLADYVNTSLHCKCTALFMGGAGLGKSPLAEALAARFSMAYQPAREYYVVTSTPDSLKRLAEESLLVDGVPIVFEELDGGDKSMHRGARLSANFFKQLLGVSDIGVVGARYSDFAIGRRQPRLVSSNAEDAETWLEKITSDPTDQLALRKRIVFFTVKRSVIPQSTAMDRVDDMDTYVQEGHLRLARKLGQPL